MNSSLTIKVPEEYHLERIDLFLASSTEEDLTRSIIQRLIKDESILVNGAPVKPNYKVKTDDEITVSVPEPESIDLKPENISINIIYEDDHIAVINKQPGLVVHPGAGIFSGTLVNAIMYHIKNLSTAGEETRPGIVHRLDRDTSGLMVIAKTDQAYHHLVNEFSERRVYKKYTAIVTGKPAAESGTIDKPLARHKKYRHKMTPDDQGREAVTEYQIVRMWNIKHTLYTLLDIRIHTGRTHQIRVHMSSMGNPVIGDRIYSKKWEKHRVPYLLLASTELSFLHPATGETLSFKADIPEHMKNFIEKIESISPDS